MGCPRDTDGDGNCGNPRCEYCGRGSRLIHRSRQQLDATIALIDLRIEQAFERRERAKRREKRNESEGAEP